VPLKAKNTNGKKADAKNEANAERSTMPPLPMVIAELHKLDSHVLQLQSAVKIQNLQKS
jgi:hypothetical protein